jgi:hypothetical protein
MEPDSQFLMYGRRIVALELPAHNQNLCVDHENDVLLNVQGDRFDFSGNIQSSMPNVCQ